jgi:hypothetical protein
MAPTYDRIDVIWTNTIKCISIFGGTPNSAVKINKAYTNVWQYIQQHKLMFDELIQSKDYQASKLNLPTSPEPDIPY